MGQRVFMWQCLLRWHSGNARGMNKQRGEVGAKGFVSGWEQKGAWEEEPETLQ